MTAISITPGYPNYSDTDGSALNDGYVFIGLEYQNPITAPTVAYWDQEFKIPADQPLRTSGGYIVRNGTPAAVYTGAAYSILVQNKNLVTVYNAPSAVITNVTNNIEEITQYQGAHASDITTRTDGTALQVGDLYFNTTDNVLKIWDGSGWVQVGAGAGTSGVVTLTSFGADPTGVDDSTAAIQSALDSGSPLLTGGGSTYRVDSSLSMLSNTVLEDCTLDCTNATGSTPCLTAQGALSSSLTLVSNAVAGDRQIVVADSSSLSQYDWILISSAAKFAPDNNSEEGEFVQVSSQSSGDIVLLSPLVGSYATADTAIINKVVFVENLTISRVSIIGSPISANGFAGFVPTYCSNVLIENCTFKNLTEQSVQLVSCINSRCTSSEFLNSSQYFSSTVGFSVANCTQDSICETSSFNSLRQSFAGVSTAGYPGISRRCTFDNNTVYSGARSAALPGVINYQGSWNPHTNSPALSSGVGTEGDYYICSREGSTVLDGVSGWQLEDLALFNNGAWERIEGFDAIFVGEASEDIFVTNNSVFGSSKSGIKFEGSSGAISNNSVNTSFYSGIYFQNYSYSLGKMIISDNKVDDCGLGLLPDYSTAVAGILVIHVPLGASVALGLTSSLAISGNSIQNIRGHGVRIGGYQGAGTSDGVHRNIAVTGNAIRNCDINGIRIQECLGLSVSGNSVILAGLGQTASSAAVEIVNCDNSTISSNVIRECLEISLKVSLSDSVSVVSNSIVNGSAIWELVSIGVGEGIVFSGNSVQVPTGPTAALSCPTGRFAITGNSFLMGGTGSSILLGANATPVVNGSVISGNVFAPFNAATVTSKAVSMQAGVGKVVITSNTMIGTGGIVGGSGSGSVITNNIT